MPQTQVKPEIFYPRPQKVRYGAFTARRASYRRVIAVCGDMVLYSTGGDHNYVCSIRTIQRWGATRTPTGVTE